jgi:hypothetical protein
MKHLGEYAKNRREYYNNRVSKLYGISPGVDVQTLMTYGPDQWKLLQPSEPKPEEKPKPAPKAPIAPPGPIMPAPVPPLPGPAVPDEITTIDYPTGSGLGIVKYHVGSNGKAIANLNQNLFDIPKNLSQIDDYYSLKFSRQGDLLFAVDDFNYMVDVGPRTGALTFTNLKDDTDTLKQSSYPQTLGFMLLMTQRGTGGVERLKKYNDVITAKDIGFFASLFDKIPIRYLRFKPRQPLTSDNSRLKYVQDVLVPQHNANLHANLVFTPYKEQIIQNIGRNQKTETVKVGANISHGGIAPMTNGLDRTGRIAGTKDLERTMGAGVNVKLYKNLAELKRRAQMLVGQLRAGNNSKEIFQELKEIENILKKKNGAKK